MTCPILSIVAARIHTFQSSFTIRIDAIFTNHLEAAFTTAIDCISRVCASACLCPARNAD